MIDTWISNEGELIATGGWPLVRKEWCDVTTQRFLEVGQGKKKKSAQQDQASWFPRPK